MIEIRKEQEKKIRCYLVGKPGDTLTELKGLVKTLGMETAKALELSRLEPTPAYGIGSGKVTEIISDAKETGSECIIFDFELEPTKQRNWEKAAGIPVFDRHEVILRIFAQRAKTKEAVLQVELAQLEYSLPRLAHMYGDMAKQRGGNYGSRGAGEKQLELDQRAIRIKIQNVKKDLKAVISTRETQRKRRERIPLASCALVGYTNAGKSSLLNALTGADAFVENELFATLDPTTRRLSLGNGKCILLTDTVGFISNLPHTLIDAFKSTLEEAARADLLVIVVDASDPEAANQYATVLAVLNEIGANMDNRIVALNKTDRIQNSDPDSIQLDALFPNAVRISAKTGTGLETLSEMLAEKLSGEIHDYILPGDKDELLKEIRATGVLYKEEWLEDGIHVTARSKNRTLALLAPYLVR